LRGAGGVRSRISASAATAADGELGTVPNRSRLCEGSPANWAAAQSQRGSLKADGAAASPCPWAGRAALLMHMRMHWMMQLQMQMDKETQTIPLSSMAKVLGRHTPRGRSTQGRVIFRRQHPVLYTPLATKSSRLR
ncbi:hypothetical protein COCVIDRAFT_93083, partial [Bipolaris victoriae FI3]